MRLASCALLLLLAAPPAFGRPGRPARAASFDWDENTVHMKTDVYLQKRGGGEVALALAKFDRVKDQIGKPGPYKDLSFDLRQGFRDMTDRGGNTFLRDLKSTLATKRGWQGPAWHDFVEQLSTPQGAHLASIITAREHSPETIYSGLKFLKQQGLIRYLPPRRNLFAVNRVGASVDGEPLTGTTPARKLAVQQRLLDDLQVRAQRQHGQRQVWHFSDDTWENYAATRDGLSPELKSGRWPNVDIVVHYTGTADPAHRPEVVTLAR